MTTLDKKYAIISAMNIDVSKRLEQFTQEQLSACDTITQAIMDFNFKGAPKPVIPSGEGEHEVGPSAGHAASTVSQLK